jgi:hypothetical protein
MRTGLISCGCISIVGLGLFIFLAMYFACLVRRGWRAGRREEALRQANRDAREASKVS